VTKIAQTQGDAPPSHAFLKKIVDGTVSNDEHTPDHIVALATEINAEYRRVRENIELLCRLCAKANTWPAADKAQLRSLLDFDEAKFSKLATAGANEHLWRDDVKPHLPTGFSLLYELAKRTPAEIDDMIKKGVLHSRCTRATILAHVAETEVSVGPVAAPSAPVLLDRYYRLRLPSSTPDAKSKEFEESLAKLAKAYRAILTTPARQASPTPTRH